MKFLIEENMIIDVSKINSVMVLAQRKWYGKSYKVVRIYHSNNDWYQFTPRDISCYEALKRIHKSMEALCQE